MDNRRESLASATKSSKGEGKRNLCFFHKSFHFRNHPATNRSKSSSTFQDIFHIAGRQLALLFQMRNYLTEQFLLISRRPDLMEMWLVEQLDQLVKKLGGDIGLCFGKGVELDEKENPNKPWWNILIGGDWPLRKQDLLELLLGHGVGACNIMVRVELNFKERVHALIDIEFGWQNNVHYNPGLIN